MVSAGICEWKVCVSELTNLPSAATVVPSPNNAKDKDLDKKIIEFVQAKVAPHKRLRGGVIFLDAVPKSPSGKILRKDLRVLDAKNSKSTGKL